MIHIPSILYVRVLGNEKLFALWIKTSKRGLFSWGRTVLPLFWSSTSATSWECLVDIHNLPSQWWDFSEVRGSKFQPNSNESGWFRWLRPRHESCPQLIGTKRKTGRLNGTHARRDPDRIRLVVSLQDTRERSLGNLEWSFFYMLLDVHDGN